VVRLFKINLKVKEKVTMRLESLLKATMVVTPLMFAAGCTTNQPVEQVDEPVVEQVDEPTEVETVDPVVTPQVDPVMELETKLRQSRVVYFDFDQSTIRPEFVDILSAHAAYLSRNTSVTVRLEGHADERGTPEYNIALGERRAKAIADFLISSGVSGSQLEVISYGEERPAALGHNATAWDKNRRVEVKY
jgi:peptidoglycan-associated lipoprotein